MLAPDDIARFQHARLARDARFDGVFYTAVLTTGIYCRPVCPAPPPKPANVRYYRSAAGAAHAGFRPCLRCRPELAPEQILLTPHDLLRRALALIAEGTLEDHSVAQLAAQLGVSARQLQRVFHEHVGASPHQVHANRRLLLAKQLLTESALPIAHVGLAAGFGSVRRFNSAFIEGCGLAPGDIRRTSGATSPLLQLRLCYRPPLDFPAMLGFMARRAIPGLEKVTAERYLRVVGSVEAPAWMEVSASPRKNELRLSLHGAICPTQIAPIVRRVRRVFDLDADLAHVHTVLAQSPRLAQGIAQRPGLRVPGAWDGFELAIRAVLGQQVSVAAATTLARRLVTQFGAPLPAMPEGLDRAFPAADVLADAAVEDVGLPRTRAATVRAVARAYLDGRLDFSPAQPLDVFIERCTAIAGIGPWTAHYMALRALGHPDAFPAGDLVLQKTLEPGTRLSERALQQRSERWRPWRAYAVLHLWHLAADTSTETS